MSTYNISPNDICKAEINLKLDKLNSFGRKAKLIFDVIISFTNNYIDVYVARDTIAARVGCVISYVDKIIARLVEIGALIKIKRNYKSNLYKLNDIFYIASIRDQLRHLFSSFCTWGMASLMRAKSLFKGKESLSICTYNYNNSRTEKIREWTAKDDIEFLQQREKEKNLPVNVLKRINESIFKRETAKVSAKYNAQRLDTLRLLKEVAAAPCRYVPTSEDLKKFSTKKVEQNI